MTSETPIRSVDDTHDLIVNTELSLEHSIPRVTRYLPLPILPARDSTMPEPNVDNYNLFKDHLQEAVNVIPIPNPYQREEPPHYLKLHDIDHACYCISKYVVSHIDRLHFYLSRTDSTIPCHEKLVEKSQRFLQMLFIINTLLEYERYIINFDREEIERAYFERLTKIL